MILEYEGKKPEIHPTCFVAESADVIGDVVIGEHSSVWFRTVVRGDVNFIRIGKYTNIQDASEISSPWGTGRFSTDATSSRTSSSVWAPS